MRLNKYQRAWIKKLKSGTTKKAKGDLIINGGAMCCLGVAIKTMGPLSLKMCQDNNICTLEKDAFPDAHRNLHLRNPEGLFNLEMISPKWAKIIDESIDEETRRELGTPRLLTSLNDSTCLTHVQIGQFIDENREAVFVGA